MAQGGQAQGETNSVSGDVCEGELSGIYTEYIKTHLNAITAKCNQIYVCSNNLLDGENKLLLLNNANLKLNKTCSLVYRTEIELPGNFSQKCTMSDRNDIREVIETQLGEQFENQQTFWSNLRMCLKRNYGDEEKTTNVDKICGLVYNKSQICPSANNVHKKMETFFSNQIQHLKCTCRALMKEEPSKDYSLPIVAGVLGALLLLVFFAIGIFCYSRRNAKRKRRQQQSPNVIYMHPPKSENCPVYQEIFDDRGYQGYKQSSSANPPTLPMRYTTTSPQPSGLALLAVQEDANGYLEPAAASSKSRPRLPVPGNTNPNYGAPPEYRETDADNNYFEPLPSSAEDGDKGYDTLDQVNADLGKSAKASKLIEADKSDVPKSQSSVNPIPAKRTKIDDQRPESPYFVLEKDRDSATENVSV